MNKKDSLIIGIISGIVVAIFTAFIITPFGDWFYKDDTNNSSKEIPKENSIPDNLPKIIPVNDTNIYYLQSYHPIEISNSELILTLNNSIEFVNQNIELKIVEKHSGTSEITKNIKVGDVYIFNDFIFSFLALEKNISNYDLKLKIEKNSKVKNSPEEIKKQDVNEKVIEVDYRKQADDNKEASSGRPMRNDKSEVVKQDLAKEIKKALDDDKKENTGRPMR
jgi:hypothetical protein